MKNAHVPLCVMDAGRPIRKAKVHGQNSVPGLFIRGSTTTARHTVFDFENLNVTANFPLICSGASLTGRLTPPISTMISFDLDCPRRDVIK
jgi:hypothetical protein